jgi:hypothetical protein
MKTPQSYPAPHRQSCSNQAAISQQLDGKQAAIRWQAGSNEMASRQQLDGKQAAIRQQSDSN